MRQGQQNRRGRGRGRKPQNPLARNFESNGPDVKIRGTAAHIAEKYLSLARDALASGDMVTAESYLQHAEHYNRIIMAAQSAHAGARKHQMTKAASSMASRAAETSAPAAVAVISARPAGRCARVAALRTASAMKAIASITAAAARAGAGVTAAMAAMA